MLASIWGGSYLFNEIALRELDPGAIAMVGIVGTGLAFALYYRIMLSIGPSRTSVVAYLIPAVAVLYGAVLLAEPVGNGIAIGLVLILAGSYLTARRARVPA